MQNDKIILYDSNDAAKYCTNIEGWVSSKGHFYGKNEHGARYDGSTHKKCTNCNNIISTKSAYTLCNECREKCASNDFLKKYPREWTDEYQYIYSEKLDEYFHTWEDFAYKIYGETDDRNDVVIIDQPLIDKYRLILCEPTYLSKISDDHWYDELAEDQDLPEEIQWALDQFNKSIEQYNSENAISWFPGKYRVKIHEQFTI